LRWSVKGSRWRDGISLGTWHDRSFITAEPMPLCGYTSIDMELHAMPAMMAWIYQKMLSIEAVIILRVMLFCNLLISLGTSALTPRSKSNQRYSRAHGPSPLYATKYKQISSSRSISEEITKNYEQNVQAQFRAPRAFGPIRCALIPSTGRLTRAIEQTKRPQLHQPGWAR
jgi:hypothetical protein